MNLVKAEFERLLARGFVRLMLVVLAGAFAVTVATTLASSHLPDSAEIAAAEQQAQVQRRDMQTVYDQCLREQQAGTPIQDRTFRADCEFLRPNHTDPADFLAGVFVFEHEIRVLVYFLIAFLSLFGFLVGASFVGADLTSGGMTNLLLWQPRRTTVLGTKLGALLASVLGLFVVGGAVYIGVYWLVARFGGMLGQLDAAFWRSLASTTGRGLVVTLAATALGFAIATLGRHTAAALGVVAGYAVVWELGVRIVLDVNDAARPDQWMLSSYVMAWSTGEYRFWDKQGCQASTGIDCDSYHAITGTAGLVVLAVVVGAAVAAAFVTFRRRDLA